MITRRDVLADAIDKCTRELYSLAQPKVNYDDFVEENKIYLEKEKEYYSLSKDNRPPYHEYMGPKPYEFYYLPREIFKEIADSYVEAYKLDGKQELLDVIEILKKYCEDPIVDKWIEGNDDEPGHRGYEHSDNLKIEIKKKLEESPIISVPPSNKEEYYTELSEKLQNKFFEFLDMAGNFFNWTGYLNAFNTHVYLGGTPSSNKESVIENWKKYRNIDIEIDESKYNKEDDDDLF